MACTASRGALARLARSGPGPGWRLPCPPSLPPSTRKTLQGRAPRENLCCSASSARGNSGVSRPRHDSELHAVAAPEASSSVPKAGPAAQGRHEGLRSASSAGNLTCGRLELIVGPMFAGKTSELLRRVKLHEADGMQVLVVKSAVDNRYADHEIVTHDGIRRECHTVSDLLQLRDVVGEEMLSSAQVIAIDEAQFFGDLQEFCSEATDLKRQTVLVAGLSGDFRRRPFGAINDLLSLADRVTQLSARCSFCHQQTPAPFTLRLVPDERTEVVGGSDKYVPVCRHHYTAFRDRGAPLIKEASD